MLLIFLTLNLKSQNKTETYETEEYQIEYPIDWSLNFSKIGGMSFAVTSPLSSDEDKFSENINLIIQDLKGLNIDLNKYVSISKEQLSSLPQGNVLESKRKNIKGKEHHIIVFKGFLQEKKLKGKQLYFIKNEKAYVLTFTAMEKDYNLFIDVANKILNSFKLKK